MKLAVKRNITYKLALAVMLFGNVCLYTLDTMIAFLILSFFAMAIVFFKSFKKCRHHISVTSCIKWLTLIYGMYMIYGLLFLRAGDFNWDMILFTYVENIAIYICIKNLIKSDLTAKEMLQLIIYVIVAIIVYLFLVESDNIFSGDIRIGDTLSGNVNTVGAALGILSMFMTFAYCMDRKKSNLIILILMVGLMLLTGSKKVIVYVVFDLLILQFSVKGTKRIRMFMWTAIAACVLMFLIMSVPYFYNIIGFRLEDMVFQLFGVGSGTYSRSTDLRSMMISEGFQVFLSRPLLGGGWNYYQYCSKWFDCYSHANYTELLCSFGIIGTCIYYLPYIYGLCIVYKRKYICIEVRIFTLFMLIAILVQDWMEVAFSAISIYYVPIIFLFVVLELYIVKGENQNVKDKNIVLSHTK